MAPLTTAVTCFLCRANIPFSLADRSRLVAHLATEHQVAEGSEYLVAGCTMSHQERLAIQNVVKGRQPKLVQLEATGSEEEDEVEATGEEGGELPSLAALEPVTSLTEGEEDAMQLKVETVWSEAGGSGKPRGGRRCPDCDFTCKLQIQLKRHREVCGGGARGKSSAGPKSWKLKVKTVGLATKRSSALARRAGPGEGGKKAKKSPYVSPGKGKPCNDCGKEFRNEAVLERHIEDLHRPGEFPCPGEQAICGKVFTSRNKMSSHYSRNCNPNNPAGAQAIARRRASLGR